MRSRSLLMSAAAPNRSPRSPIQSTSRTPGATDGRSETWDSPAWGRFAELRSYPFIAYFEVLARYAIGDDANAIDEFGANGDTC